MQLDEQEWKLSANIRYVYVLGNVLVTYNLMLIATYLSSTVPPSGGFEIEKQLPSFDAPVLISPFG